MASRNVLKVDAPNCYYHVYARGSSRQRIFREESDYFYFLTLFHRYLSRVEVVDANGKPYSKLHDSLELLCYCLMSNHFHLLIYQEEMGAMSRLMRGVMTSYSRYFNKKYNRSGSLFETRYKASLITRDNYLLHISRYVHLNPNDWQAYPYSSIRYYRGLAAPDWLQIQRVSELFSSAEAYMSFVEDYKDMRDTYEDIKHQLAD
jgi:putative transposase